MAVAATGEDSGLVVVPRAGVHRHGKRAGVGDSVHHRGVRIARNGHVPRHVGGEGGGGGVRLGGGQGQPVARARGAWWQAGWGRGVSDRKRV